MDAQGRHPGLALQQHGAGEYRVTGSIGFHVDYEGEAYEDDYDLTIEFPQNYPEKAPKAYDYGHRIPTEFDHVFPDTRALCLGAPVEVNRVFARRRTLTHFLEELVEPYLFAATYTVRKGQPPYRCLPHGGLGLLDYYSGTFDTDELRTMKVLKVLADGRRLGRWPCPCESGKRVNQCHGEVLTALQPHQSAREFELELNLIVESARRIGHFYPAKEVRPRSFLRSREQSSRRRAWKRRRG